MFLSGRLILFFIVQKGGYEDGVWFLSNMRT
jgi:hypothetical protein